MVGQGVQDAAGHGPAVRSPVQRGVRPTVGVSGGRWSRQVGRVREDPVEPTETGGQVGPDRLQRQALRAGPLPERAEGVRVQVGRDHAAAASSRPEGRFAATASDLEDPNPARPVGERQQEPGVLSRGVDARIVRFATHRAPG
jgi:hypothetical protein